MKDIREIGEKFNQSNFGPVYEDFAFWFIIAGALCAECIPLAAALIGAAGVLLGTKKSAARRTGQRKVRRMRKPRFTSIITECREDCKI